MRKSSIFLFLVLLLATTSVAFAHRGTRHFIADLDPLNNSGVEGTAVLSLTDETLTVHIQASGVEPDMVHPQHIHGFDNPKNAVCPPPSADDDGDGLVELGEGLPFYGPVLLPLTPFPVPDDSTIDYWQTFDVSEIDGLQPINTLQNRAIVLHGMTVNGEYIATLPIACGQIRPAPGGAH